MHQANPVKQVIKINKKQEQFLDIVVQHQLFINIFDKNIFEYDLSIKYECLKQFLWQWFESKYEFFELFSWQKLANTFYFLF
jgi:hypothetical protein